MDKFLEKVRDLHFALKDIDCRSWSKNLCGACAFSAFLVSRIAKSMGLKAEIKCCHEFGFGEHCWCVVEGKIVDATATQFYGLKDKLDNGILVSDGNPYGDLIREPPVSFSEKDFIPATENWLVQSVSYCIHKYGRIIENKVGIEIGELPIQC